MHARYLLGLEVKANRFHVKGKPEVGSIGQSVVQSPSHFAHAIAIPIDVRVRLACLPLDVLESPPASDDDVDVAA